MYPKPTRRPPPWRALYDRLYRAWGPQHWWPGRTPLEVMVGAVLTQNTAWSNVEKAIRRLRQRRLLSLGRLHETPLRELADAIRPAGYFNVKARRLRALTRLVIGRYGSLPALFRLDTGALREALLSVNGVGPETADSILLYAAGRPVFVVDAYTRRFLVRHRWRKPDAAYEDIAALFTNSLPPSVPLYNEFHALIVHLGKTCCRPEPRCSECPLARWLPPGGPRM